MFTVNDPRVNRKRSLDYNTLTEALEAINKFGPTIVTGISGSIQNVSKFRKTISFDGERVVFSDPRFTSLRDLTERLPPYAVLTRLHISFRCPTSQPIKLRLTSPMFASDLYE